MKKLSCVVPLLWLLPSWGQTQTPRQNPPEQVQAQQSQPQSSNWTNDSNGVSPTENAAKSNDRLFFTLPNRFTVENAGKAPRLTTAEKFKTTAQDSFDPVEFVWYGALAGIAQAENDEPQYGQGAKGYADRYGIRFADGTIENFMAHGVFASILRQDPRYYQLGKGGYGAEAFTQQRASSSPGPIPGRGNSISPRSLARRRLARYPHIPIIRHPRDVRPR
jgi:hypothetical protein